MAKNKQAFVSPDVKEDELAVLSKKLLEVTAKLQKSEKERSEMLANISHDLRAPITAIRSALDLLKKEGENISTEDFVNAIGLIDRRTTVLESLINDMYFLFCVEDQGRDLDIKKVSAGPFLEEYFYDATMDTKFDDHETELNVPMDMDCMIEIDVQKFIRVLDNLMTNAAKYSGSGSKIGLSAELSKGKDKLTITVSDNGIGIPEESIPHLFDRTYTVSSARTPGKTGGSGLGLAIVKAVVEKHGGEIMCESKLGEGSKFVIEMPCVK